MTFNPNIPTGLVKLSIDYLNIKNNFSASNTVFGVDHNTFSDTSPQKGYHKSIHIVPQATPAAVSGYGQLYSNTTTDINTDTALFWETGSTSPVRNVQLTMNFVPKSNTNGFTFLPGGLILQWGTVSSAIKNTSTNVNFATSNMNFPNNCFGVTGSLSAGTTSSTLTISKITGGTNKTAFNYFINSNSSQTIDFTWLAIGN